MWKILPVLATACLHHTSASRCRLTETGSHVSIKCESLESASESGGGEPRNWAGTSDSMTEEAEKSIAKLSVSAVTIEVQHTALGDSGLGSIARTIGKSSVHHGKPSSLNELVLRADGNSISDDGGRLLGGALGQLHNTSKLSLSLQYNSIGAMGLVDLASGIGRLKGLQELTLRLKLNHIGSAGLGSLGASIAQLSNLKTMELDLYSNGIDDAGVSDFAASLSNLAHLSSLKMDLQYNPITPGGGHALQSALHSMKKLTSVHLALPPAPSTTHAPAKPADAKPVVDEGLKAMINALKSEIAALKKQQIAPPPQWQPQQPPAVPWPQPQPSQPVPAPAPAPRPEPATTPLPAKEPETEPAKKPSSSRSHEAEKVPKDKAAIDAESAETSGDEGSSGGFVALIGNLAAVALILGAVTVGLQSRGYNVHGLLRNAGDSAREFALNMPMVQDYNTGLTLQHAGSDVPQFDTEAPEAQMSSRFVPPPPTLQEDSLAARCDRASAKLAASRGHNRDVSFDDILNQNLTQLSDRME